MNGSEINISVPGQASFLAPMRAFFGSLLSMLPGEPFDADDVGELQLVLQEATMNAMRHAVPGEAIDVGILIFEDRVVLEVGDHGEGFDPTQVPEPDISTLPEGGYGVFIISSYVDRVETRREDGKFVLSLTRLFCRDRAPSEVRET